MINIGSLRWIEDLSLSIAGTAGLLKESLTHTFVDNDECDFGKWKAFSLRVVLVCENHLKLVELKLYDLFTHGITNTITIDEDVVWQLSLVIVAVGLECTTEVFLKDI